MKRAQLALLFIPLILALALWLSAPWWWPYVQSLGVPLDQNATRIQTVASVLSLLPLVIGLILWYLHNFHPTPTRDAFSEAAVLETTTPEAIRAKMEKGGQINWIDRVATEPRDLQRYGRLAIVGRSRQGKTREAAELIRRAVTLDLVHEACIYQPGPALRFVAESSLRAAILARVDRLQAVLLFIDDLPYHYPSAPDLAQLHTALTTLTACKTAYVIITARDDQLTADHVTWLAAQQFHQVTVPDLTAEQTGRLVDNAAGLWQLQVNAEARQALIDGNNGTPELPLISLKFLDSEGIKQVNGVAVTQVLRENVAAAWEQMRRETIEKRQPAAAYLLDALTDFHVAGVRKAAPLVLAYAMHLWQHSKKPGGERFQLRWAHTLRQTLPYLRHFDIIVNEGQLRHPDQVVENGRDPLIAARAVGEFLLRYRYWLRHPWLRRFHRDREAQRWALFDLGLTAQNQQTHAAANRYYTVALGIEPHYWFYNNRGNARAAQGDLPGAIADYDQAIHLNPADADAYNNRGIARAAQGDLPGAIADYDQAIHLNPADATVYNNRGNARKAQGDLPGAIADYDQAIHLNPADATAYNNRGIARSDQGDLPGAIADYDQAIHLNPADATAYYNRGNARKAQGDLPGAIADYDQAIHLNPADATAYYNRGIARKAQGDLPGAIADYRKSLELADQLPDKGRRVYRSLGGVYGQLERWSEAQTAYQQALVLEPDSLVDWISLGTAARHCADEATQQAAIQQARRLASDEDLYNRACLESVAGHIEQALDLLAQAVAATPAAKDQAQQDPDLSWVRATPRFAEIVGLEETRQNKE